MTSSFIRTGSANTFDAAVRNITSRQSALASLQENLTSGKKVVRASDDPTGAANAERALTRISRIVTDQRALESQRNAITQAEGTLGDVTDALQRFRELVVSAGDGVHSGAERRSIAIELQGLRDQIFSLANRKDTNGLPLFSALGSALAPFVGPQASAPDYTFNGLPGQSASSDVTIPFTLDGESAFMNQPARDLVFNTKVSNSVDQLISTDRTLTTDNVVLSTTPDLTTNRAIVTATATAAQAAGAPYPQYTLTFNAMDSTTTPGTTTGSYSITENPSVSGPIADVPISFPTGKPTSIAVSAVPGLSFTLSGTPQEHDTITIDASPSVFSVLDNAIKDISNAANNNGATQAVSQALHNIDISMSRVSAIRGQAGDLLNRADRISTNQDKRSIQLESDRSRAEDLDMVKGIADFQNKQTGYSAALQTYAQVQKLSLFNFIG
jgi:flagellar hook-associated protein 3 FlgL